MEQLLQHLVNGLVLGGTYALLGIGLTLIFGLMSVANFAHGEFYTLGAYAAFAALAWAGLPFVAALLAAIAAGALRGALCERALRRRSWACRSDGSTPSRSPLAPRWRRPRARCSVRCFSRTRRWATSHR